MNQGCWGREASLRVRTGIVVALIVVLLSACGTRTPRVAAAGPPTTPQKVITIGGSTSYGWGDTVNDKPCWGITSEPPAECGYLGRAFIRLSELEHARFTIVARLWTPSIDLLRRHLRNQHPMLVIFAYGILDYLTGSDAEPEATFTRQVREEIWACLNEGAAVIMTTPPITQETLQPQHSEQELAYAAGELKVAESFRSPRVYVIDLTSDEKAYLLKHKISPDLTFRRYYSQYLHRFTVDGWHLNEYGHRVAGKVLADELAQAFSLHPYWIDRSTPSP